MKPDYLWTFLWQGYLLTVAIELPILLAFLSRESGWKQRAVFGLWLTAFTYPVVVLVLPLVIWPLWGYTAYVAVAEVFAPAAECLLFSLAMGPVAAGAATWNRWRDWGVIVGANLASFLGGGWLASQFMI